MEYYRVRARISGRDYFLVWCGNDDELSDCFWTTGGVLATWGSHHGRESAARSASLTLTSESESAYDFDWLREWLSPDANYAPVSRDDLSRLLGFWNIMLDFSETGPVDADHFIADEESHRDAYSSLGADVLQDILFSDGECPPAFVEFEELREVLSTGITMISGAIAVASGELR